MSPLAEHLHRRIALEGPLSVAAWMAECLGHPRWGYYRTRDPLGAAGDFTTAPEISQVFGELLGLWLGQAWLDAGAPPRIALVELGPGRGTLMADALRALRHVPGFLAAAELHLVETSPSLRAVQAERLAAFAPSWHDDLSSLPALPLYLLANEFFDALPVRQFLRVEGAWRERLIGSDEDTGGFRFLIDRNAMPLDAALPPALLPVPEGAVLELSPASQAVATELAARLAAAGGAALIVDYGSADTGFGDTLQALRAHAKLGPLETPGEADLTAHVDFAQLAEAARRAGAAAFGSVEMGAFLLALGLGQRTAALAARATPAQAEALAAAAHRLTAPEAMGTLFRCLALLPAGAHAPPGFPQPAETMP